MSIFLGCGWVYACEQDDPTDRKEWKPPAFQALHRSIGEALLGHAHSDSPAAFGRGREIGTNGHWPGLGRRSA
jgi:hypothetical protein